MQRPPQWINADQATVNDDNTISLSYTIDPLSEIKSFGVYRRKDTENDFTRLAVIQSSAGKVILYRSNSNSRAEIHLQARRNQ